MILKGCCDNKIIVLLLWILTGNSTFSDLISSCSVVAFTSPAILKRSSFSIKSISVFTLEKQQQQQQRQQQIDETSYFPLVLLQSSPTDDDNDVSASTSTSSSTRRRRRVRRKDDLGDTTTTTTIVESIISTPIQTDTNTDTTSDDTDSDAQVTVLRPRKESRVAIKVRDIRELTGIAIEEPDTSSSSSSTGGILSSIPFLQKDSSSSTSSSSSRSSLSKKTRIQNDLSSSSSLSDDNNINYDTIDPIQRLLYDAKEMKNLENERNANKKNDIDGSLLSTNNNNDDDDENDGSIGSTIRSIISTIVTVDFFVVCGFLLWFLVGIFASYILKDDTIQILFNSNFQQLVQPALGILMIAALSDAVLKKGDDDDDEQQQQRSNYN